MNKHSTREAWLQAAIELLRPRYAPYGDMPKKLEAITSWPVGNAKKVKGQTFYKEWTGEAKTTYVTVSPTVEEPREVLAVLIHELIHALRPEAKHGKLFREVAIPLGLEGDMRATVASAKLKDELQGVVLKLGPYPHVPMVVQTRAKGESKNQVKLSCCLPGYTVWLTPKQYAAWGAPGCPKCKKEMKADK